MFWRKSKLIKELKTDIKVEKMCNAILIHTINSYVSEKNSLKGQLRVAKINNKVLLNENRTLRGKVTDLENNIELLVADRENAIKESTTKKTTLRRKTTKKETTSKNTTSKK